MIRPGTIGAARLVRQYAQLSQSGDVVDVEAFDPNTLGSNVYLASMDLEVRPASRASLPSFKLTRACSRARILPRSGTGSRRMLSPRPTLPTSFNLSS